MDLVRLMQRKSRPTGAALLAVLGALAGCQNYRPPAEPPPHKDVTLTIACPEGLQRLLQTQARAWQGRQQARVVSVGYAADKGPEAVAQADVWVIATAELPHWASAGRLAAVPDDLTRRGSPFRWSSLLRVYSELFTRWEGKAFAVPLVGEAPVCLYRADLFARDKLPEPATWEAFARAAEHFRANRPAGTPGPSLPPLPAGEAELDRLFYTVAASYARRAVPDGRDAHFDDLFSFHYDQKTGRPRIATRGFELALRTLVRLQACRPTGTAADPGEAFLRGEAVLCVADAGLMARAQQVPALRDRVGVCRVPGAQQYVTLEGDLKQGSNRVPYRGGSGWLAAVPASAANPQAAWSLLADLAGPQRSGQIALEPRWAGPTRDEQVLRERWDAFDLRAGQPGTPTWPTSAGALKEALLQSLVQPGIKNPVTALRIPDQAAHRRALVAAVRRTLLHGGDPAAELGCVATEWARLDETRGAARHRTEYRLSLGLLGD